MLRQKLLEYSAKLSPFAEELAENNVASTISKNSSLWRLQSEKIGLELNKSQLIASDGALRKQLVDRQVGLITSLPRNAAERALELAAEAVVSGSRGGELRNKVLEMGDIAQFQAERIARTEVSTAVTELTRARSEAVGVSTYTWLTASDGRTRISHKEVDGKVFAWDQPPLLSDGNRHHPGQFPNCRCLAIPNLEQIL
jgi:SPP1 gp7 family putative phage head morphogenesis protein